MATMVEWFVVLAMPPEEVEQKARRVLLNSERVKLVTDDMNI